MVNMEFEAPCPCGSGKKYKHCCLPKKQQILEEVNGQLPALLARLNEYFLQTTPDFLPSLSFTLAEYAPWLGADPEQLDSFFETCPHLEGSLLDWLLRDQELVNFGEALQIYPFFYRRGKETPIMKFREEEATPQEMPLLDALEQMTLSFYRVLGGDALLELEDVFTEERVLMHHRAWDLEEDDYALVASFQIAGPREEPLHFGFQILAWFDEDEGEHLENIFRRVNNELVVEQSFPEFLTDNFWEVYWLLVCYITLEQSYELMEKRADEEKIGHGILSYKYLGEDHKLEALLFGECEGPDQDQYWIKSIRVPSTTRLLFYWSDDELFVDYFHPAARIRAEQILAPLGEKLELEDATWESFPELLEELPAQIWEVSALPEIREMIFTLVQLDLYDKHKALSEATLKLPFEGVSTLRDLAADPVMRFYLSLYLERLEEAFQETIPQELTFNYDALRQILGADREKLDWLKYATVLKDAIGWLQSQGYSWEVQRHADGLWRIFAPGALPDLDASSAWAAALAAKATGEEVVAKLSRAFAVPRGEIRRRLKIIKDCFGLLENYQELFPQNELEQSFVNSWELTQAADFAPVVDLVRSFIEDDDSLKYLLATVLTKSLQPDPQNPKMAMFSFFYALAVHKHEELGGTILEYLAPGLIPSLVPQIARQYEELATLTLQVLEARGDEDLVLVNIDDEAQVLPPPAFELEAGELALCLVFTRRGQRRIFSALPVEKQRTGEFATFVQQAFWNWRKDNPKGDYPSFMAEQGYVLLYWMAK